MKGSMTDRIKHLIVCAPTAAFASAGIALLMWMSLVVTSCQELMEHLLAPVWFAGLACALAMGVGKEYGDECAEGNQWDWQDIAAGCIGSLVGAGFAMIITILI